MEKNKEIILPTPNKETDGFSKWMQASRHLVHLIQTECKDKTLNPIEGLNRIKERKHQELQTYLALCARRLVSQSTLRPPDSDPTVC